MQLTRRRPLSLAGSIIRGGARAGVGGRSAMIGPYWRGSEHDFDYDRIVASLVPDPSMRG
jgi:hypothetical protein